MVTHDLYLLFQLCIISCYKTIAYDNWHTVKGVGFVQHYTTRTLYGTDNLELIEKCKHLCVQKDTWNKTEALSAFDTDFIECKNWGFSYTYMGSGKAECRYPVAPWQHLKYKKCKIKYKGLHIIHANHMVECMRICLYEKDGCKQFTSIRVRDYKKLTFRNRKKLNCHYYNSATHEARCNVRNVEATVHYVQTNWIDEALALDQHRGTHKTTFMFMTKKKNADTVKTHLLTLLSTLRKADEYPETHSTQRSTVQNDHAQMEKHSGNIFHRHTVILVVFLAIIVCCILCCLTCILYKLKSSLLSLSEFTQYSANSYKSPQLHNLSTRNIGQPKTRGHRTLEI